MPFFITKDPMKIHLPRHSIQQRCRWMSEPSFPPSRICIVHLGSFTVDAPFPN
jgi:hypothetical protein